MPNRVDAYNVRAVTRFLSVEAQSKEEAISTAEQMLADEFDRAKFGLTEVFNFEAKQLRAYYILVPKHMDSLTMIVAESMDNARDVVVEAFKADGHDITDADVQVCPVDGGDNYDESE